LVYKGPGLKEEKISRNLAITIVLAVIILITLISFKGILALPFDDSDEYSLIESSRIQSGHDLATVLTSRIFNGYEGKSVGIGMFYRPVSNLSYSLDYFLWDFDPFGYHLTDLLLHLGAVVTVFFLIYLLTKRNLVAASLGSMLFGIHPILIETIPSSTRRHDVLVALFVLLAFLFFIKYFEKNSHTATWKILSVLAYILAVGSKEIAVIFPVIVLAYAYIFSTKASPSWKNRLWRAVRASLPYVIVTVVYVFIRALVLGDIGGYSHDSQASIPSQIKWYSQVIKDYFLDLLRPAGIPGAIIDPFPGRLAILVSALACVLFIGLMVVVALDWRRSAYANRGRVRQIIADLFALGAAASVLLIISYPLFASFYNGLVEKTYTGTSHRLLATILKVDQAEPLYVYFYEVRNLLLILYGTIFLLCAIAVYITTREQITRKLSAVTGEGKMMIFLSIWILLPLSIFLATRSFCHYYTYISLFPAAFLWSLLMVKGVKVINGKAKKIRTSRANKSMEALRPRIAVFIFILGMLMFMIAPPVEYDRGEWSDNAEITNMLLTELGRDVQQLPRDAVLNFKNMPEHILSHEAEFTHPRQVVYPWSHTFMSWLNFNFPGHQLTILTIEGERIDLPTMPSSIKLNISKAGICASCYEVFVNYSFD